MIVEGDRPFCCLRWMALPRLKQHCFINSCNGRSLPTLFMYMRPLGLPGRIMTIRMAMGRALIHSQDGQRCLSWLPQGLMNERRQAGQAGNVQGVARGIWEVVRWLFDLPLTARSNLLQLLKCPQQCCCSRKCGQNYGSYSDTIFGGDQIAMTCHQLLLQGRFVAHEWSMRLAFSESRTHSCRLLWTCRTLCS